jgi:hypothetical protein
MLEIAQFSTPNRATPIEAQLELRASEFRDRARQAIRQAAKDPAIRARYLSLAVSWNRLADALEKLPIPSL